jgi:hypothetical protein
MWTSSNASLVTLASEISASIRQAAKLLEFPSPEEFVRRYVAATPLATIVAHINDGVRDAIVAAVAMDLKESVSAGGLAFSIESHLLRAYA